MIRRRQPIPTCRTAPPWRMPALVPIKSMTRQRAEKPEFHYRQPVRERLAKVQFMLRTSQSPREDADFRIVAPARSRPRSRKSP